MKCNTCENYKKKQKIICFDCTRIDGCSVQGKGEIITECCWFDERRCGNCGWHGEHVGIKSSADCLNGIPPTERYLDSHVAENCQWKPLPDKEPVWGECGGVGKVCVFCGEPRQVCAPRLSEDKFTSKPCPSCFKLEQEEEKDINGSDWHC